MPNVFFPGHKEHWQNKVRHFFVVTGGKVFCGRTAVDRGVAADTLAAVVLIRLDRERPEQDHRLVRMLLTTADANRILWQRGCRCAGPCFLL